VHVWVLLVFLAGIVLSSVGQMKSHGLANLGTVQHGSDCCSDDGHGHAHDEDGFAAFNDGVGHPHHSGDHSHDRAHALPPQLALGIPDASRWQSAIGHWTALLTAYRLERPPMA
jgi:hypothetical protein